MPKIIVAAGGANPQVAIDVQGSVRFFYSLFLKKDNGDFVRVQHGSNKTPLSLKFEMKPQNWTEHDVWTPGDTARLVWVSSFATDAPLPAGTKFDVAITQGGKSILDTPVSGPVDGSKHLDIAIDLGVK